MKNKLKQNQKEKADDISIIENEYLEVSKKLATTRRQCDDLEKLHWILREKLERAKGFLIRTKYDSIKCVGEELILLYYRGELVMKHELDDIVEYYFKNMYTRVCPDGYRGG